jgi:hypothetical protein
MLIAYVLLLILGMLIPYNYSIFISSLNIVQLRVVSRLPLIRAGIIVDNSAKITRL